jgi:hypothetical protein
MIEQFTHWDGVPVISQADMRGEPDAPEALIMTRKVFRGAGKTYYDYAVLHLERLPNGTFKTLRRLATGGGGPDAVIDTYAAWLTERLNKLDQIT